MNADDLKKRTKTFALRVIRLVEALPRTRIGEVIGKQLLKCGTSVGANYRAACRAKSRADFLAKMRIVEEEADESCYWMELIVESNLMKHGYVAALEKEAGELVAIVVASVKTVRSRPQGSRTTAPSLIPNRQSPIVNRQSSIVNRNEGHNGLE